MTTMGDYDEGVRMDEEDEGMRVMMRWRDECHE